MSEPKRWFEPIRVSNGFIEQLRSMGVPLYKKEFPLFDGLKAVPPLDKPLLLNLYMGKEDGGEQE